MKSLRVIVLLLLSAYVCSDCPDGFLPHMDSCYALIRSKASWAEASVYCQAVGAHLASIETQVEEDFLVNWLLRESSTIPTDGVWVAGQDFLTEGDWMWGFKGARIGQTWWHPPNQPHNGVGEENCLTLWRSLNFKWGDQVCDDKLSALCESEHYTTNPHKPVVG